MPQKSYLTGVEARILREYAGLSPKAWSVLLDCGEQSVRNIESGGKPVGRQMAALMVFMAYKPIRQHAFAAIESANSLLRGVGPTRE